MAVAAPIIVVHWLLTPWHLKSLTPVMTVLDSLITPLSTLLTTCLPIALPTLTWKGQTILLSEPLLASLFTLGVVGCTLASQNMASLQHQVALNPSHISQPKYGTTVANTQPQTVLVYILFQFDSQPTITKFFADYTLYQGNRHRTRSEGWLLQFNTIQKALQYATEVGSKVISHYNRLRVSDARPPFQMAIHTVVPGETHLFQGIEHCQLMIRHAQDNQVVVSEVAKQTAVIESGHYSPSMQSIGLYQLNTAHLEEIFRLTL